MTPPGAGTGPSTTRDGPGHEVRVEYGGEVAVIRAQPGESVLDAADRHGLALPRTCRQGWCGTCAARLVSGEVDQSGARRFYPEDRAAGFALLCTARPLSALVVAAGRKTEFRDHRLHSGLPVPRG